MMKLKGNAMFFLRKMSEKKSSPTCKQRLKRVTNCRSSILAIFLTVVSILEQKDRANIFKCQKLLRKKNILAKLWSLFNARFNCGK